MGLTAGSTGKHAMDMGLMIKRKNPTDKIIALAGNPNVGKSSVFNALTGMNQHTGNWPGKTVTSAQGFYTHREREYIIVDLPGAYSLMAHSTEEEVARDYLCFGQSDVVVVVCDATCLERNLNLVIQTMEMNLPVILCINLMDEARKKNIRIDAHKLKRMLGIPVVLSSARLGSGLDRLIEEIRKVCEKETKQQPMQISYLKPLEQAMGMIQTTLTQLGNGALSSRWCAIHMLDGDQQLKAGMIHRLGIADDCAALQDTLQAALEHLRVHDIDQQEIQDKIVSCIILRAEKISAACISADDDCHQRDRTLDQVFTSRLTGIPIMLFMLFTIFWITITASNYPSEWLATGLFWIEDLLTRFFMWMGAPSWLHEMLVFGVYRVLAWVVAVMLPPMAIFFPLFTILEDFGYLPRVAFNLDYFFKKACACGKQSLTMCMGFGCNAAGVVGCRIIDSPRERLIAIITNNFVPCNGRFPTLIAIISMFFVGASMTALSGLWSTFLLTCVIVLGVCMTLLVSRMLSLTILKGIPSSFTLELPPYRRPQFRKVIVRSMLDRTLFVLGRAVCVAIPAGFIIWLMANISVGDSTLLLHCATFLDPFAKLVGLDGVILLAFILGFPANEIVFPIMIMTYLSTGSILELDNLNELKTLLMANGWTWLTALCTMLLCLMHWPCSTTCLTIKKETNSLKWTAVSIAVPTLMGLLICFMVASTVRLFGLI